MTGAAAGDVYALKNVRHRYGTRVVLEIPELAIARGETLGIIGPSGAGKTTLLRLLQFLEQADEGEVAFCGHRIACPVSPAVMRRVTTVFQRPLMLDRTVRDNVAFGMTLRRRPDPGAVDALLDRLALGHLAGKPARLLSGGEIQRVALARAVVTRAEVLLLDEPAANLDPGNVALVESMIREQQAIGTTIVLVTHNTHEARRLAARTLLLLDGRMVEIGPTSSLFDAPRDPRTRAFLGGALVY